LRSADHELRGRRDTPLQSERRAQLQRASDTDDDPRDSRSRDRNAEGDEQKARRDEGEIAEREQRHADADDAHVADSA